MAYKIYVLGDVVTHAKHKKYKTGLVVRAENSEGKREYLVKFCDGTIGWYNASELEEVKSDAAEE